MRRYIAIGALWLVWIRGADGAEPAAPDELTLVRDGTPAAVIVLGEHPVKAARLAACELRHHLARISGAVLPIVTEPDKVEADIRLLVGDGGAAASLGFRAAAFRAQEYAVAFRQRDIVLIGRDRHDHGDMDYERGEGFPSVFDAQGTMYAAYDFLERHLGVRWYLPTELWHWVSVGYQPLAE